MLDVKRLRVLREVAAHGSFSAAAEALAYTQSAVSQQIAALEKEAGTRLVDRAPRGVTLTEAGRALVTHANAILARLADAEAELDAIAGLRGGRLRLTTFATAGSTIVPAAIVEFRRRYPGVELTLRPAESEEAFVALREGDADIAMTVHPFGERTNTAEFDFVDLMHDPLYLMLPVDHPLAEDENLRLADLSQDDWILSSSTSCPDSRILTAACREAGFEPRTSFDSDDYPAIQGFVAGGFGVSFIPNLALGSLRDDVVIRSLGPTPPTRRIQAATLAGSWSSPAKQAMLDVLIEVAGRWTSGRESLALAP